MLAQYNPDNPTEPGNMEDMLSYKLSVASNLPDAVTLSGTGKYKKGASVTVKATVKSGYKFLYWTKDNGTESFKTTASFTYTMTDADVSFVAVCEKAKSVTVKVNDTNAGTVSGSTSSIYKGGTTTVSTTAKTNYSFLHWLINDEEEPYSMDKSFKYTMGDEDVVFTAVYKYVKPEYNPNDPAEPGDYMSQLYYRVNVDINDADAGVVSGSGKYKYGTSVKIGTSPTAGYEFRRWLKGEEEYSTAQSFNYTIDGEDVAFTAEYEYVGIPDPVPTEHKVYLQSSTQGGCTFSMANGASVDIGSNFSVTASLGTDYKFIGWYIGDNLVGSNATYQGIMGEEDITLIAMCEYSPDAPVEPNSLLMLDLSRVTMGVGGIPLTLHAINTAGEEVATTGWTSSNSEVATVNENGVVTSVGEGTATITVVFADGSSATCEVTVMNVTKGDVNGDGKITIADVSGAVLFALGEGEESTKDLSEEAADFNENGIVTVTDAISILHVVMNSELDGADAKTLYAEGSNPAQAQRRARAEGDVLAVEGAEVNAGEAFAVPVNFAQNDGNFISFQFDLVLPEGIELQGVDAGGNAEEQTITIARKANYVRIAGYSLTNTPFANTVGEDVIYLNLVASKALAAGEYEVAMSNVEVVRKNISTVTCAKQTMTVAVSNEATAIGNASAAAHQGRVVYDLTGRRVAAPRKGVYIVNGKKQLY